MNIGTRIALGFATVLLLTVAVAFVGWNSLRTYAGRVDLANHTAELDARLKSVRLEEARFVNERNPQVAAVVPGMLDTMRRAAVDTRDTLGAASARLADDILGGIDGYRTAFSNFVAQDAEATTRTRAMAARAKELRDIAEKIGKEQSERFDHNKVSLQDATAAAQHSRETADRAHLMIEQVLEARRMQGEFARTRARATADTVVKTLNSLLENAEALKGEVAGTADEELGENIVAAVRAYRDTVVEQSRQTARGEDGDTFQARVAVLEKQAEQVQALVREMQENQVNVAAALQQAASFAQSEVNEAALLRSIAMRMIQSAQAAMLAERDFRLMDSDRHAAEEARTAAALAIKETLDFIEEAGALLVDAEGKAMIASAKTAADAFDKEFAALVTTTENQHAALGAMAKAAGTVSDQVARLVAIQHEDREAGRASATLFITIGSLVALALGAILAWFIDRAITVPLRAMTHAMDKLAEGDLSVDIPGSNRKDELRHMADALRVFKENALEMRHMEEERESMRRQIDADRRRTMNEFANGFEQAVSGVVQTLTTSAGNLGRDAQEMSSDAALTTAKSTAVATASQQATANVQTVAAAAEELSASIAEISRQLTASSQVAMDAADKAKQTNQAVQGLSAAAQRIGDVVVLIQEIAEQTNLLALNATIEAARAGEAGKGFAVVATEVKNLAGQTAKATEEISAQVAEMQLATGGAVDAIRTISDAVGTISRTVTGIAGAMEEQGSATREIAQNVHHAAEGTQEVMRNIAEVTTAAGKTGGAADAVLSASRELTHQADRLRNEVTGFLNKVRSA